MRKLLIVAVALCLAGYAAARPCASVCPHDELFELNYMCGLSLDPAEKAQAFPENMYFVHDEETDEEGPMGYQCSMIKNNRECCICAKDWLTSELAATASSHFNAPSEVKAQIEEGAACLETMLAQDMVVGGGDFTDIVRKAEEAFKRAVTQCSEWERTEEPALEDVLSTLEREQVTPSLVVRNMNVHSKVHAALNSANQRGSQENYVRDRGQEVDGSSHASRVARTLMKAVYDPAMGKIEELVGATPPEEFSPDSIMEAQTICVMEESGERYRQAKSLMKIARSMFGKLWQGGCEEAMESIVAEKEEPKIPTIEDMRAFLRGDHME